MKRPLWIAPEPLVLASTSRTRRSLLQSAGLAVSVEAPGVDERAVEASLQADYARPLLLARCLAAEKALAVSRRRPENYVIGADQVLGLDQEIFHKPPDRDAARTQLSRLSGRTHTLICAGVLAVNGKVIEEFSDEAVLTMRQLSPQAIETYLAIAGPTVLDSVGCYQVEGLGIHLFEKISGDHATILGLPLQPLLEALRRQGCLAF